MRRTLFAALALTGVGLAGLAIAQAPPPAPISTPAETSTKAADVPAGAYTMDSRHANVLFSYRHMGLSIMTARFDTVSGKLNFDPAKPDKSTVEATIAVSSVSTGVLNAQGERAFDKEIAEKFLGGVANPNMTFKSTSIKLTGAQTGQITGDLTLNGVTKPVVLDARFEGGKLPKMGQNPKYRVAFTGHTVIDRTAFGLTAANLDFGMSKEVEIRIGVEFTKDQ
jgi:polyisoprenoid-binding protein YceI